MPLKKKEEKLHIGYSRHGYVSHSVNNKRCGRQCHINSLTFVFFSLIFYQVLMDESLI